eukprot:TRINITY_DN2522_c0_g1_i2.p1 TRINITY_DN2522_c0_g1~~TRINITY_DN2522_c0_g1_i2.p1  ORF type:complete len:423 (-),score=80.83 TRINITY_DN2522_c0_g1_i2:73-1341(-)
MAEMAIAEILSSNVIPKTDSEWEVVADSHSALGYILLCKSRIYDDKDRDELLDAASKAFYHAKTLQKRNYTNVYYNIACIHALLGDEDKCKDALRCCSLKGILPNVDHVISDEDLFDVREKDWFQRILSGPLSNTITSSQQLLFSFRGGSVLMNSVNISKLSTSKLQSSTPLDISSLEKSIVFIPTDNEPKGKSTTATTTTTTEDNTSSSPSIQKYTDEQDLNDFIMFDEELNVLQNQLMQDGFEPQTVIQMMLELGKAKKEKQVQDQRHEENRKRLHERLKSCKLREKTPIPADGNCQFSSISDQLYGTIEFSTKVRLEAMNWLRKNKDWILPNNGSKLSEYAYDQTWDQFCDELSRNGIWGNHLTLVAMAEVYGSPIKIISSVASDDYIIQINPTQIKSSRVFLLSHYAEFHYSSLCVDE